MVITTLQLQHFNQNNWHHFLTITTLLVNNCHHYRTITALLSKQLASLTDNYSTFSQQLSSLHDNYSTFSSVNNCHHYLTITALSHNCHHYTWQWITALLVNKRHHYLTITALLVNKRHHYLTIKEFFFGSWNKKMPNFFCTTALLKQHRLKWTDTGSVQNKIKRQLTPRVQYIFLPEERKLIDLISTSKLAWGIWSKP